MMAIQIRGIPHDLTLQSRVARQIAALLLRFRVKPATAQVAFFDDNGPRGGAAIRCALTVRFPRWPVVRVEQTRGTAWLAFDGSVTTLERQLERHRKRERDRRRRPKKYYAAKRLLTGGREPAERE